MGLTRVSERAIVLGVARWILLASVVGVIVGASVALFIRVLFAAIGYAEQFQFYFLVLPLALIAVSVGISRFVPGSVGNGTDKVIEAVHKWSGRIPFFEVPAKVLATILTIASGGSLGHEGPAAQLGAGMMSGFASLFRLDQETHKKLVICGVSAGFAAVFGTPLAGALFGVEVLFVSGMLYELLLPALVAGLISYEVAMFFGGQAIWRLFTPLTQVPEFTPALFLTVIAGGAFFGFCAWLFIKSVVDLPAAAKSLHLNPVVSAFIGGGALIAIALVFSPEYLGISQGLLESGLYDANLPWYSFLLKIVAVGITLAAGGSGGIIAPMLIVGVASGNFFAQLTGANVTFFAVLGLASVLAGAANTPIAATVMALEFFGPAAAPFVAVSCFISFMITGDRSALPAQLLASSKASFIKLQSYSGFFGFRRFKPDNHGKPQK